MNGDNFVNHWRRMQGERKRSTFFALVPPLALLFIMGFRATPDVLPPPQLHPVRISLSHTSTSGQALGGGGQSRGETAKAGKRAQHAEERRAEADVAIEQAPEAQSAQSALEISGDSEPANGSDGDDDAADSGAGQGSGGGNGDGTGLGMGPETQSPPSDKTQAPEPLAKEWVCDWPWLTKTKDATVIVQVSVNKLGRAYDVDVLQSNHSEFESVAAECALHARYRAGTDHDGKMAKMQTRPLPIHFLKYVAGEQ